MKDLFFFSPDPVPGGGAPPAPPPPPSDPPPPPSEPGEDLPLRLKEREEEINGLKAELAAFKDGNGNALVKQKDEEIAKLKAELASGGKASSQQHKEALTVIGDFKTDILATLSEEEKKTIEDLASVAGGGDTAFIRMYMKLKANKKLASPLTPGGSPAINTPRAGGTPPPAKPSSLEETRKLFIEKAKKA